MNQNFNNNGFNESVKPFSRSKFFSRVVAQIGGVYIFHNPLENGYYIGQSTNLADRFTRHSNDLLNNCHSNSELQNAFNKILKDEQDPYQIITCQVVYQIDLMVLPESDKLFEIIKDLTNRESELIELYRQDKNKKVYNSVQEKRIQSESKPSELIMKKPTKSAKPCEIDNIQYPRINQAVNALKNTTNQVSRETLINRLKSNNFPTWKFLDIQKLSENKSVVSNFSREQIQNDSKANLPNPVKFLDPITKKVTVFPSIRKCVDKLNLYFQSLDKDTLESYKPYNIKINNPSITRRCNNPSNYNNIFQWANFDELDSFDFEKLFPKKVSGQNKIYSSISEAAKKMTVSRITIINWCNDSKNVKWFYLDK